MRELKSRENDTDFIKAKQERMKYIESRLAEVEEDSLMQSAEIHLITEEDLNELIKPVSH